MTIESIWKIRTDSNKYRLFEIINNSDPNNIISKLGLGISLTNNWQPIDVDLFVDEDLNEEKKKSSNFMWNLGLSIDNKGKESLVQLIGKSIEFLPINTPIGNYWMMNIFQVDCLNRERSVCKYFTSGKIMDVLEFVFFREKIKDQHIFIIPELLGKATFVSTEFKRIYEANHLTGLIFTPI